MKLIRKHEHIIKVFYGSVEYIKVSVISEEGSFTKKELGEVADTCGGTRAEYGNTEKIWYETV